MNAYLLAVSLGIASGLLVIAASRIFWLGWFMLAPLCVAIYLSPPAAAGIAGLRVRDPRHSADRLGSLAVRPFVPGESFPS